MSDNLTDIKPPALVSAEELDAIERLTANHILMTGPAETWQMLQDLVATARHAQGEARLFREAFEERNGHGPVMGVAKTREAINYIERMKQKTI